jgi:hypothetical protein
MIKNLLIGFAVTFVAAMGFGFLDHFSGSPSTSSSTTLPMVFGGLVFFMLQMRSGNRKEARADDASRQASLSAVAPAGQALLYVYREGFAGKAVGWDVSLDGTELVQLRSPRFTHVALSPGSHTLRVSVAGFAGTQNKPGEITFEAQPGEVIVFAMKAKIGALSSSLLFVREADPSTALWKLSKIPMVTAELASLAAA